MDSCPGCKGKRSFALIKSRRHQLWYRIERERLNLGRYPLFSEMRILFDKGKQVGPDPITHYVYLWRHGKIDIYIGKGGVNGRWAAHMRASADDPNDRNETKTRYFLAHLAEMTCYIIAEELRTDEATERETVEIRRRGYAANGTGTLRNAKRGNSVTLKPRAPRKPAKPRRDHLAQKRLKAENECAEARALGLSQAETAAACTGMDEGQLRGKIARALCLMGPGRYTRAQVMRKADVGKLFKTDADYIRRAFFLRADLVGLIFEPDGESLVVRKATADEKRARHHLFGLSDRPPHGRYRPHFRLRRRGPRTGPGRPAAPDALPEAPIERADARTEPFDRARPHDSGGEKAPRRPAGSTST